MTDIKKTGKDKGGAKAKKLQLKKEIVKDLMARDTGKVKGGAPKTGDIPPLTGN